MAGKPCLAPFRDSHLLVFTLGLVGDGELDEFQVPQVVDGLVEMPAAALEAEVSRYLNETIYHYPQVNDRVGVISSGAVQLTPGK